MSPLPVARTVVRRSQERRSDGPAPRTTPTADTLWCQRWLGGWEKPPTQWKFTAGKIPNNRRSPASHVWLPEGTEAIFSRFWCIPIFSSSEITTAMPWEASFNPSVALVYQWKCYRHPRFPSFSIIFHHFPSFSIIFHHPHLRPLQRFGCCNPTPERCCELRVSDLFSLEDVYLQDSKHWTFHWL